MPPGYFSQMEYDDLNPAPDPDRETYLDGSIDDEDQLQPEDTLDDPDVDDVLDRGYSPPEHYSTAQDHGSTPREEIEGETLEQRMAQEVPEPDPYSWLEHGRNPIIDGDVDDGEVGGERAGRLVALDGGIREDVEGALFGVDVGIDGAAASAEEAAIHIVPEDEPPGS